MCLPRLGVMTEICRASVCLGLVHLNGVVCGGVALYVREQLECIELCLGADEE